MALSTGNPFLDALGGSRWADPWINITFNDSGVGGAWTGDEIGAFTSAFQAWANVAAINWGFGSVPGGGNIVEFKSNSAELGATVLADHNTPDQATHNGRFNTDISWTAASLSRGGNSYETFVHEIGHAIGLAHPHSTEMGTGRFPGVNAQGDAGSNGLNHTWYTVMSYRDPPRPPNDDYGMIATPMAFDVAAIQALYGANTMAGLGDDTYVLPDANAPGTFWSCIWDVQGIDSIVYNGNRATLIDLRPATLLDAEGGGGYRSYAANIRGGFTIAADWTNAAPDSGGETGVVIENARGGRGADTLMGNRADNVLDGRGGADSMNGGDGDDMVSYAFLLSGVTADLLFPVSNTGEAAGDSYMSIERLEGSAWDDHLGGDHGRNTIYGGDGFDLIAGRGGDDLLSGSWFNDTLIGDSGADTLHGGGGNDLASYESSPAGITVDLLFPFFNTWEATGDVFDSVENLLGSIWDDRLGGDQGANTLYGWSGADFLAGRGGADRLLGDAEADTLLGESGNDSLYGGAGNDSLDGGTDLDLLEGGPGDDTYIVNSNADRVREAAGNGHDRVYTPVSFTLHLTLAEVEELRVLDPSSTSKVNLGGSNTANLLVGNDGAGRLDGRDGADTMIGLGGADTFVADQVGDRAIEADEPGIDIVLSSTSFTLQSFVEKLTLTGLAAIDGTGNGGDNTMIGNEAANLLSGDAGADYIDGKGGADTVAGGDAADILLGAADNDLLFGDDGIDKLFGGAGSDTLSGGEGDDLLRGEADADTLIGGGGFDFADYTGAAAPVAVDLVTGGTLGDAAGDQYDGMEGVSGTLFNDSLVGDAGHNLLRGSFGHDTLGGGPGGRDTLQGGDGNDIFLVDGSDRVLGGNGYDDVRAVSETIADGFRFTATAAMSVDAIYGNNGHDLIDASGLTAVIYLVGHDGNDTLRCGAGDDAVFAGEGADSVLGGAGFDQLHGGAGNDTMVGGGGPANPPWSDWLFGGDGDDVLTGSGLGWVLGDAGNDTLTGGAGDLVMGEAGNDSLGGGAGFQQMIGGTGNDTMTGSTDFDRFDFDDGWGDDVVTDFEVGLDEIALFDVAGLDLFSQLVVTNQVGGVRVAFGGSSIFFAGLTAAALQQTDFLL